MRKTKAYYAVMSSGDPMKIDEDEIDKVADAAQKRSFVFVRGGMINAVHIIGIKIDQERIKEWFRECAYGDETGAKARENGITSMENIFSGTRIGKIMDAAQALRGEGKDAIVGIIDSELPLLK